MLPEVISEGKLSLLENEVRPALTFSITLTRELEIEGLEIKETLLKNRRRLNYAQVDYIIDSCPDDPDYRMLNDCYVLSRRLMDKRRQRGALVIFDLQRLLFTNEEGQIIRMKADDAHKSNIIVQEFMILANMAVAEYAAKREFLFLFRNHTARKATPQREEILAQLQIAASNPKQLDVLLKRSDLWFNKAEYGSDIKGHYGLNLPVYTHVTSPLRRLPDLINHELLKTQFAGKEPAFQLDELIEIASEINKIIYQESEQKKEFFKAEGRRETQEQIEVYDSEKFMNLPADEFKRLLKEACRSGIMNEEFERALTQRFENENVGVDQLAILLFDAEDYDETWKNLRAKALETTLNRIGFSDQVLHTMEQLNRFTDYRVDFFIYQKICAARIIAKVDGIQYSIPEYQLGINKKKARRAAANEFLKCYLSKTLVPADETKKPSENKIPSYDTIESIDGEEALTEDYVGQLSKLCKSHNVLSEPKFEFSQSGPDHDPIHTCKCKLKSGEVYLKTMASARNRKLTRKLAAKKMCEELLALPVKEHARNERRNTKPKVEESKIIIADNYVGILIETCVKSGMPMPTFEFESEGPQHKPKIICKVSVNLENRVLTATGSSYNKKFAKQLAAREMVLNRLK